MSKYEPITITDDDVDYVAEALIPGLNAIADKQTTTTQPYRCEVYRCTNAAGFTAWVTYFTHEADAAPTSDRRALCRTHALEYDAKHKAGKLNVAGRPALTYYYRWGLT